ncbi:MAG: S-layer homology domain-containing protein, partial [Clostridia bacterium]|nr:S-layer homology domain-containing protein [Clostridia bacterium]
MKKAAAAVLALCFCTALLSTAVFGADDILLIAPAPSAPGQAGYTDVPDDHWAKESIDRWTDLGVLQGNPDGTFAPDEGMTPAQFVTFLSRALKLATADLGVLDTFEGIDKTAWYAQALANCV